MARIDKLIEFLADNRIHLAAMQPDQPIMLDKGGGESEVMNDNPLSARKIELLLSEILTTDQKERLRASGRAQFEYETGAETATITALHRNGKLSVYFSMTGDASVAPGLGSSSPDSNEHETSTETEPTQPAGGSKDASPVADPSTGDSFPSEAQSDDRPESSDAFAMSIDEGIGEDSSFADSTARPTETGAQRGQDVDDLDERSIPMKAPGTRAAIDQYLEIMAEEGCSDLHLTSGNPPLYRKDGEIVHLGDMPSLSPDEVEELLVPIIPDRNYDEFLEIRDTDFSYEIQGVGRFRTNIFMDRVGPGAVFRLIPDELMTAEDLGLSDELLELCFLNKGLVLVTGPTGSGKSTTLAALIDYINRKRTSHIITLEDPIEFVHPNKNCLINQREVGVHTMGFDNAIRAALREDPDIVLVGELRDLETIELALETAETGHVVFGTLHTNTAPSTVDRLIDQFPSDRQAQIRTMLAESLRAVIAQTLCKRKDGGRIAAMEILMANNAISNHIRQGKTHQIPNVMETGGDKGMVKMNEALMEHVQNDIITPDEAFFNAVDKDEMRRMLKRAGHHIEVE